MANTHDQVTFTKNGSPAAVIRDTIAEAEADIEAGRTQGEDEVRAEFGVHVDHRANVYRPR